MPNTFTEAGLTEIRSNGMNWLNAKYKLVLIGEQGIPAGRRLSITESVDGADANTGMAYVTMNTQAAHPFNAGETVLLSKIRVGDNPYVLGKNNYTVGEFVTSRTDPANIVQFKVVRGGSVPNNDPPFPKSSVGYYVTTGGASAAVFYGFNHRNFSPNQMAPKKIVSIPTTSSFRFWGYNPNKFGARDSVYLGYVYPSSKLYLSDWIDPTGIVATSDALTGRILNALYKVDANDVSMNRGTLESYYHALLLVKTANNYDDPDLAMNQQKVIAFWDMVPGIGIYGPSKSGVGLYVINNFINMI